MSEITIWHNSRCSKSRAALALLEDRGIAPQVRRYLDDPPTTVELRAALDLLGLPAARLVRWGEAEAKTLDRAADDETLIAAMAATPKLIERPVVFAGKRAALGRPPEAVLEILP